MKKLLVGLCMVFICTIAQADTFNQYWYTESGLYAQTSCQTGGDINLPATAPTKYGYDFIGWEKISYAPLKYLESTGTQWIDTGVSIAGGNIIEAKVLPINGEAFIGNVGSNYNETRNLIQFTGNRYQYQKLTNYTNFFSDAGTSPAIVYLDTTGKTFRGTCNGVEVVNDTNSGILPDYNLTVKISAHDYNNHKIFAGRYYWVKISDSTGTLVRDMIPVLDENNVPCMYDKVTQQIFYNQGTGDFIAGPQL